jgi:hypothetical protein
MGKCTHLVTTERYQPDMDVLDVGQILKMLDEDKQVVPEHFRPTGKTDEVKVKPVTECDSCETRKRVLKAFDTAMTDVSCQFPVPSDKCKRCEKFTGHAFKPLQECVVICQNGDESEVLQSFLWLAKAYQAATLENIEELTRWEDEEAAIHLRAALDEAKVLKDYKTVCLKSEELLRKLAEGRGESIPICRVQEHVYSNREHPPV